MLEGVVIRGTGAQASVLGRPIGGKTGTTNDFRSAWFMGFSPQIVVGVFVGFDDNRSLGKGETGAVAALPVFIEFMQEAQKTIPPLDFKAPPNTKFAMVGPNIEAFRPGTEPRARRALPVVDQAGGGDQAVRHHPRSAPCRRLAPETSKLNPPPTANRPPKSPEDLNGLWVDAVSALLGAPACRCDRERFFHREDANVKREAPYDTESRVE